MEKLLKQIDINTEPKRSSSIVVSDNTTRFKTWFKPPIELIKEKNYDIALVNLETYYSFPNIEITSNHFRYYSDGRQWFNILIVKGSDQVEDIDEFVQQKKVKITTKKTLQYPLIQIH